jgi:hypothetical protein
LLAGGMGAPGAAQMPPALAQVLQKVIAALTRANAAQTSSQPASADAYSPTMALQQILQGQTFGMPATQSRTTPNPQFQYQPAPIYSPQLPYLSYAPPQLSEQTIGPGPGPIETPTVFDSGLQGSFV